MPDGRGYSKWRFSPTQDSTDLLGNIECSDTDEATDVRSDLRSGATIEGGRTALSSVFREGRYKGAVISSYGSTQLTGRGR